MTTINSVKQKRAVDKEAERANQFPRKQEIENGTDKPTEAISREDSVPEENSTDSTESTRQRKRKVFPKTSKRDV